MFASIGEVINFHLVCVKQLQFDTSRVKNGFPLVSRYIVTAAIYHENHTILRAVTGGQVELIRRII